MKSNADIFETETNVLCLFLVLFILLFANMPFDIYHISFMGSPYGYEVMTGLYHKSGEGVGYSTMLYWDSINYRVKFQYSLKENILSMVLASITIAALIFKKYRFTGLWFLMLSLSGFFMLYYFIEHPFFWYTGFDFISEKALLLIASLISLIISLRILRIKELKLFNHGHSPNGETP